jgi:hypothetical protein
MMDKERKAQEENAWPSCTRLNQNRRVQRENACPGGDASFLFHFIV